jgi:hypothetical protein
MNLFRSEEHVKNWSLYDPISEESIMPVADWANVLSGPLARKMLEPDYLSRLEEYYGVMFGKLQSLGKAGSFWTPG